MTPESQSRQAIFEEISSIEEEARKKALKLLPIYFPLSLVNGDTADRFLGNKLAPFRQRFHQANDRLRNLEIEEDFPTVRQYIHAIKLLTSYIPRELRDTAYYPFAGFDVFWVSVFRNLNLEDRNYNIRQDKYDLWWSPEDYDAEKLSAFIAQIKKAGLIPAEHHVHLITSDSENGQNFMWFNTPENALIYKGGHTFINYARSMNQRGPFAFGAIVLSGDDPKTPVVKVDGLLKDQGYQLVYNSWGREPKYGTPWSIEIIDPRVYVKRELLSANVL